MTNVFIKTVQCDFFADLPSRGVSSTVISKPSKSRQKIPRKMLPHTTLLNAATEEDFEEAREVMSSEYSNLPVIKNINVATEEDFEEAREVMSGEYSNLPVSKEVSAN